MSNDDSVYRALEEDESPVETSGGDEVQEMAEAPSEPDVIVGKPYAVDLLFWRLLGSAVVFGAVMGLVVAAFSSVIKAVPRLWQGQDLLEDPDVFTVGSGKHWWVAVTGGSGFVVGLVKVLIRFPDKYDGFFKDVAHQHVDYHVAPKMVVVSLISLCAGASLGPEAAMGSLGGGLGSYFSHKRDLPDGMTRQNVLNGMVCAIGPLFPSPLLAVLLMHEIGESETFHSRYMRSIAMTSAGALASFAVYFAVQNKSFLAFIWIKHVIGISDPYSPGDTFRGILIGLASAPIGLLVVTVIGVMKKLFATLNHHMPNEVLKKVVSPTVGGLLYGLIGVYLPLTFNDGSEQMEALIKHVAMNPDNGTAETDMVLLTAIGKTATLGISLGSGFVGGLIFPMIFIGACVGIVVQKLVAGWPLMLCIRCFMVGIPAAVCPMPFTLVLLVSFTFALDAYQSTPIFAAVVVSNLCVTGSGVLYRMAMRATKSSSN